MVFESVLADILNRYLKPYVKRLDTSQLKVGVWKGNVSLERLEIKEDLFDELGVPVLVKRSYVGNLRMKIPWKKLAKDPIVVDIDEIYVVVGPHFDRPYDPEWDRKRKLKMKEEQIKKYKKAAKQLKAKHKKERKGKKEKAKDPVKPDTFTEKLAAHLVKNLQVKICNVHIRYEDSVTNPSTTIAIGTTLHCLELKSTDSNWIPCVVKETATLIYKLIELDSLSLYWTTYAQSLSSLQEAQWMSAMRDQISRPGCDPPPVNNYLLQPLSALAKLKINLKPGVSLDLPQLFASLECEDISIVFLERQFKSLMLTLDAFNRHQLNQQFLKYRPTTPLTEDKRAWWHYAYHSILEQHVRRRLDMWSWKHIKNHRTLCQQYTKKYSEKLTTLNPSALLLKEIELLEDQLDVFNIVLCRKEAKKGRKKQLPPEKVTLKPLQSSSLEPFSTVPAANVGSVATQPASKIPPLTVAMAVPSSTAVVGPVDGSERTVISYEDKKKKKKRMEKADDDTGVKGGKGKTGFFSKLKKTLKPSGKEVPMATSPLPPSPLVPSASAAAVQQRPSEHKGSLAALAKPTHKELTKTEEEEERDKMEFYRAIGYSMEEEGIAFPKEYVAHQIVVSLKRVTLELAGKKHFSTVVTKDVAITVHNRPSSKSTSVSAIVGEVEMSGIPHDGKQTVMVTTVSEGKVTKGGGASGRGPLIEFELDINPLHRERMDIIVKTIVRPLRVTYDEETVDGLIGAFDIKKNVHLQELTSAASSSFEQLRSSTAASLHEAVQDRKQVEIDVTVHSPYIVVPQHGYYSRDHHLLVVDLGSLSLKGSTKDPQTLFKKPQMQDQSSLETSMYYDSFMVELKSLQVLVAEPGSDWQDARLNGCSPMHILEPTGFEIALLKSIVQDDALLPSLKIEGDIPGFELKLNDQKLRSILYIVTSLKLPPPSLVNTSTYYNELPPPPSIHTKQDGTISDAMSLSSFDDDEDEDEDTYSHGDGPTESLLSSASVSPSLEDSGDERDELSSHYVFTDVNIKLIIRKVGVSLTQTVEGRKEKQLLSIAISNLTAKVIDRSWDSQGSVGIGDIMINDFISRDASNLPMYLLKTHCLADGNFLSAKFVVISATGADFASKYTGLRNTVSASMSLIMIHIQQDTIATLFQFLLLLSPAMNWKSSDTTAPLQMSSGTPLQPSISSPLVSHPINKDWIEKPEPVAQDFVIEARFEGIDMTVSTAGTAIVHSTVRGFVVSTELTAEEQKIVASMENLLVDNPDPKAVVKKILSREDESKKMINISVKIYPNATRDKGQSDLSKVDILLSAEIQRLQAVLDAAFLGNIAGFVDKLWLDSETAMAAFTATSTTASSTATPVKESTGSALRVKLDVAIHAPVIVVPYTVKNGCGSFNIDLGEFCLSNNFLHGYEVAGTQRETVSLAISQAILDSIRIHIARVQIFREEMVHEGQPLVRTDLLESLEFDLIITRNLTPKLTRFFPEVNIFMELKQEIEFHVSDEDIQALVSVALTANKIADGMMSLHKSDRGHPRSMADAGLSSKDVSAAASSSVARLVKFDSEGVLKLKLEVFLASVSLEISGNKIPLLRGTSSGIGARVRVLPDKLSLTLSVDNLGIVDLDESQPAPHKKVVSFLEGRRKAITMEVEALLDDKYKTELDPLAVITLNIAQLQLLLATPFVSKMLEFVMGLDISPELVKNATKAAQDGALATSEMAQEVYVKMCVSVHAPTILVPVGSCQAFMVDLGRLQVENQARTLGQGATIDVFDISLEAFKASRVLLNVEAGSCVVDAERILIQPYSVKVDLTRNLCPWRTEIPSIALSIQMGAFKLLVGEEDLEVAIKLGVEFATIGFAILPKMSGEFAGAVLEGLKDSADGMKMEEETVEEKGEKIQKVQAAVFLSEFQLQLFCKEPHLASGVKDSQILCGDYGLAGFQVIFLEIKADSYSNKDISVSAVVTDMALLDTRPQSQAKSTGNRMLQHYTSNPLSAYDGKIDQPLVRVEYLQQHQEHFVFLKSRNILLLSDIGFVSAVAEFFKRIFKDIKLPQVAPENDRGPSGPSASATTANDNALAPPKVNFKLDANVADFRLAIIEGVDTQQPQALMLKVTTFCHLQLSEKNNLKQASLNVAGLSIVTCDFYNLDQASSAVLLPCALELSATGPLDGTALDVTGTVEPIRLTLSPPIIRLIVHFVQTLALSTEKPRPPPAPEDLWQKRYVLSDCLWYLLPASSQGWLSLPAKKRGISTIKNETLTLTVSGFELSMESEASERSPAQPLLAFHVAAVIQLFDWTGQLKLEADAQCEASYFNQSLSVWEPLLEPLENKLGKLNPWNIHMEACGNIARASPRASLEGDVISQEPYFSVELSTNDALQLTITRTSIQLIKDLAEACSKEYGKKLEGSVNVESLTGSPFTVTNRLGAGIDVFVKPGQSLKLHGNKEFAKLTQNESLDLFFKQSLGMTSHASLITHSSQEEHCVDLSVGKEFKNLLAIPINNPGVHYYGLIGRQESLAPRVAIVVEVVVTGAKKRVTIRSPIQVKNHLELSVSLLATPPGKDASPAVVSVVDPGATFPVPFAIAFTYELHIEPAEHGFQPIPPGFFWQTAHGKEFVDIRCHIHGNDINQYNYRVVVEEESYRLHRGVPTGVFAHHLFHVYPPATLQNLLPMDVKVEAENASFPNFYLKPGQCKEWNLLSIRQPPVLIITIIGEGMCGKVQLRPDFPEDLTFIAGKQHSTVELSILHEDLGYHRLSLYCPFWMINKTDLILEYKDEKNGRIARHQPDKKIHLLSCADRKSCKVRLAAITRKGSRTEWSKSFSLQAVGTSGRISALLGQPCTFNFGVSIQLAKFTLSKLVIFTPQYLIVNYSHCELKVLEEGASGKGLVVPEGELVPFWPLVDGCQMRVSVHGCGSVLFNYKRTDSIVLKLASMPMAICVDIQETDGTDFITFSPFYDGCVPVRIINLFPDLLLRFKQDIKDSQQWYSLEPGQSLMYTWDDPTGKRLLKWELSGTKLSHCKPINISKDGQESFTVHVVEPSIAGNPFVSVGTSSAENISPLSSVSSSSSIGIDSPSIMESTVFESSTEKKSGKKGHKPGRLPAFKGHWKSFIEGLQRVLLFARDSNVIDRITMDEKFSQNIIQMSLSLKSVGLSLVDNSRKLEVAYIGITQSGLIWQVEKKKGHWKTLNGNICALLEEAFQNHQMDIKHKDLAVNLETMEMFSPLVGALRRTHHDGLSLTLGVSAKDISLHAKLGAVQIDNQLPFSVYPQMLYAIPPPPTVASTTEPKPFLEASVVLRRTKHSNVNHFKYVHMLVQKMAINVDLGFVLSLVDFFSLSDGEMLLEAEYVQNDIDFAGKSLREIVLPAASDETMKRNFFDVFHLAPIKTKLSFNVRSVGRNKRDHSVGDRFLQLFLHSLGVILTSVQEADMNFSLFHLEYLAVTWGKLVNLLVKHYRTQGLVQVHSIVLGLDVLGNPVNIVRGVVEGTFDLFYEPIKGSVLGPQEFAEGLGIGLRSFVGGTFGGLTGAGAKITGAVGDVFAKLSFDDQFIDRRQQEKVKTSGKLGSKVGGFFKNVAEGVTGVVAQPVKGVMQEGALGLFKGAGKGIVGLLVRPAGGLIDLTSGTLEFVTQKTQVGNIDIVQIRPPRFIGRDGVIRPYSPPKAIGNALLVATNEGKYNKSDVYVDHFKISHKPVKFLLVTDRRFMIIERRILVEGWKSLIKLKYMNMAEKATSSNSIVYVTPYDPIKYQKVSQLTLPSQEQAEELVQMINRGYAVFKETFAYSP